MSELLLVEDDAHLRELMQLALELEGHRVHTARHGGEAQETLRVNAFDLVIADLMMPSVDGLQLLRWLRTELDSDVPVLVLTSVGNRGVEAEAREAGADAVAFKPLDLPTLVGLVTELTVPR